jgi:4-coumarate--CoA ligase
MSHPLVTDCAVVGIYVEAENTWHPRAFVSLTKENTRDTNEVHKEILDIAKTKLPDEKQLRGGLRILKQLPRNATGKIQRRILRQSNELEQWLQLNCL